MSPRGATALLLLLVLAGGAATLATMLIERQGSAIEQIEADRWVAPGVRAARVTLQLRDHDTARLRLEDEAAPDAVATLDPIGVAADGRIGFRWEGMLDDGSMAAERAHRMTILLPDGSELRIATRIRVDATPPTVACAIRIDDPEARTLRIHAEPSEPVTWAARGPGGEPLDRIGLVPAGTRTEMPDGSPDPGCGPPVALFAMPTGPGPVDVRISDPAGNRLEFRLGDGESLVVDPAGDR